MFVNIIVNSSRAVANIQRVRQGLNRTNEEARRMQLTFAKIRTAAAVFYLLQAVFRGVEGIMREMLTVAADLERQFSKIRNAADFDSAGLERFRESLFQLTRELKSIPIRDAQSIALAAAQAGIKNPKEIIEFTKAVAKGAVVAEDISSGELAKFLLLIIDLFDKTTSDTEQLVAVLHKLSQEFRTNEGEIVQVASKILGAGRNFGLTAEEVLALSTALRKVAVTAERASSFTAKLVQDLQLEPEKFEKVLRLQLGLEKRVAVSPAAAIIEVLEGIRDKGGDVADVLKELEFDERRVFQTTQNLALGIDGFKKALVDIDVPLKNSAKLNEDLAVAQADAATKVNQLSNAWTELMDNMGKSQALGYLVTKLAELVEGLDLVIFKFDKALYLNNLLDDKWIFGGSAIRNLIGFKFKPTPETLPAHTTAEIEAYRKRLKIPKTEEEIAAEKIAKVAENAAKAKAATYKRETRELEEQLKIEQVITEEREKQAEIQQRQFEQRLEAMKDVGEFLATPKQLQQLNLERNFQDIVGALKQRDPGLLFGKTKEEELKRLRREEAEEFKNLFAGKWGDADVRRLNEKWQKIFADAKDIPGILPQLQAALQGQIAGIGKRQAEFSGLTESWKKAQLEVFKDQEEIPRLQLEFLRKLHGIEKENLPALPKILDKLPAAAIAG